MKFILSLLCALCTTQAFATTLFSENFESGLSNWQGKSGGAHQAIIVADPLQADKALAFTGTNSAGDIFTNSVFSGAAGGSYILSFDYLGTCTSGNCGGFVGFSSGLPGNHFWLGGTGSGYPDLLPDTGKWEHVVIAFTTLTAFHLMLEDFSSSTPGAGDAYFDNLLLTDGRGPSVPEPGSLALVGLALAGLAYGRSRMAGR